MLAITEIELDYYKQLNERQKRLYVGLQAQKLGWRGVSIVSAAYKVNVKTVRKGKSELSDLENFPVNRIRKLGGGPKKKSLKVLS